MSEVAITKIKENGAEPTCFLEDMKAIAERVRERAYELFQRRGKNSGDPVDDWLRAEREIVRAPQADLTEKDGQFQMQVAIPGFDAKQVSVTASPEAVTVSAECSHKHEESDGKIHFCEFGEKTLFRQFDLPEPINVDKVTARLDKGVLRILADKVQPELRKSAAAA